MCRRSSALVVALLLASVVAALVGPPPARADLPAPVAAGESAANIDLNSAQRRVMVRWVARSTGTLTALHLRIQADGASCRISGRTGYGLGDGGSWHVTTHPVLPDGRPDLGTTLATQDFRPCAAPADVVDVRQGVVRLPMALDVTKGGEYATVIGNGDAAPAQNYTSTNFLYTSTGILGANGRNERSPLAPDAYYGLDPRELVGYSRDGGQSWDLPGGPYGRAAGRSFLPTYLQEYAGGLIAGQPYYYAAARSTADRTMVFSNVSESWTIRELGAYTPTAGTGTLTLTVDGRQVASAPVSGSGMLRAAIDPVTVAPGQVVRVTAAGLTIQDIVADTAWGRLMGLHLASTPWKVEGEPNFSHAAPVYPLPAYGTPEARQAEPPAADPTPADAQPAADPPVVDTAPASPPAPDPPVVPADPPAASTDPPSVSADPPATAADGPAADSPPPDPVVAPPPLPDPAATEPPTSNVPPVDPPVTTFPPLDPPVAGQPDVTPPVLTPPVLTPPVVKPPVVKPPVAKPPPVKPPVVKPPVVRPPRGGRTHQPPPSGACRKRAQRRRGAHGRKGAHRNARCRAVHASAFQAGR